MTVGPAPSACAGANAALPDFTGRNQTATFVVSASAECHWVLDSSNTHVVSVNPSEGYGTKNGSVWSLPGASGQVTVRFIAGGVVLSERIYTIP